MAPAKSLERVVEPARRQALPGLARTRGRHRATWPRASRARSAERRPRSSYHRAPCEPVSPGSPPASARRPCWTVRSVDSGNDFACNGLGGFEGDRVPITVPIQGTGEDHVHALPDGESPAAGPLRPSSPGGAHRGCGGSALRWYALMKPAPSSASFSIGSSVRSKDGFARSGSGSPRSRRRREHAASSGCTSSCATKYHVPASSTMARERPHSRHQALLVTRPQHRGSNMPSASSRARLGGQLGAGEVTRVAGSGWRHLLTIRSSASGTAGFSDRVAAGACFMRDIKSASASVPEAAAGRPASMS